MIHQKLEVKGVLYTNEKDQLTIFVYKLKEIVILQYFWKNSFVIFMIDTFAKSKIILNWRKILNHF